MRRRRATCAHQHEITRIIATLNRDTADAVDHVGVDDGEHAIGGAFHRQTQRVSDAFDRIVGLLRIQRQASADKAIGVQIAKHDIGVRHSGQLPALAITGWPRIGARRLRAHLQKTHLVNPADRAAACAQGFHLNHRHANAVAQEVDVLVDIGRAVFSQRDVKRGAAHIHRDHIGFAERRADIKARRRGRSGAGVDGVNRPIRHRLPNRKAAVGLVVAHGLLRAELLEIGIHRRHIALHDGCQIGVDHRR